MKDNDFVFEYNTVEKVAEIQVILKATDSDEMIRIFALRDERSGRYHTRAEIRETFTLQPSYPIEDGKPASQPEEVELWVRHDLAQTSGKSADDVIGQALAWLTAECRSRKL